MNVTDSPSITNIAAGELGTGVRELTVFVIESEAGLTDVLLDISVNETCSVSADDSVPCMDSVNDVDGSVFKSLYA